MNKAQIVVAWIIVIMSSVFGYMVGHEVPIGPRDYRSHGNLSSFSDVVESGHTYERRTEEVDVLIDRTTGSSHYIDSYGSDIDSYGSDIDGDWVRDLPKKFVYIDGVVIDREPCKCSAACTCTSKESAGRYTEHGETHANLSARMNALNRRQSPTQVDPQ